MGLLNAGNGGGYEGKKGPLRQARTRTPPSTPSLTRTPTLQQEGSSGTQAHSLIDANGAVGGSKADEGEEILRCLRLAFLYRRMYLTLQQGEKKGRQSGQFEWRGLGFVQAHSLVDANGQRILLGSKTGSLSLVVLKGDANGVRISDFV